jgi:hypothetical protein
MFYSIKNVYLARDRKNKNYCYVVLTRDTIDYLKKYLAEYQPHYWLLRVKKVDNTAKGVFNPSLRMLN